MLTYGKCSGILLRGSAMEKLIEEGEQKWVNEKVTPVVLGVEQKSYFSKD